MRDYEKLISSLDKLYPLGHTPPSEAIDKAFSMDADDYPLHVVLITDDLSGIVSNSYQELRDIIRREETKENSFSVIDVNTSNSGPNYALMQLTNEGSGIYHRVVDKEDIIEFEMRRIRMIRDGTLRNVGMNLVVGRKMVESVRVIGHEEAETLTSTSPPGNYPFEGKRTLMLDVWFRDGFSTGAARQDEIFIESFVELGGYVLGDFDEQGPMMNGAVYADSPFGGERVVYGQDFRPSGHLEHNPSIAIIPYIMITGLGELMRQSELACSDDSVLNLDALIEMGEVVNECRGGCARWKEYVLPHVETLKKVKAITEEQNLDLCTR